MQSLSDEELLEIFELAMGLNLEKEFLQLLQQEITKRGLKLPAWIKS